MSETLTFETELDRIERFLLEYEPKGRLQEFGDSTIEIEGLEAGPDTKHRVHLQPLPKELRRETIFLHPDAHPLVLDAVLLDKYGQDWLGWAMPVVEQAIEEAFSEVIPINLSKVMAAQLCHTGEGPWTHWEQLLPVVMSFTDILPDFQQMQVPTTGQLTVAVGMMDILEPRRDLWSDEVRRFMRAVFRYEQVAVPIESCAFLSVGGSWLPMDRALIGARWAELKEKGNPPTGETIEDEQLRRMWGIYLEVELYRKRLREQLRLVRR